MKLKKQAMRPDDLAELAIWKEQARALGIVSEKVLKTKIEYIHNNPVERKLVEEPGQWLWSSWHNYSVVPGKGEAVSKILCSQA